MNNPSQLRQIDNDLQLSSASNYLGAGIDCFKVNRTVMNDIQTCHGNSSLATAGCYITESAGTAYQLNQFPLITIAQKWELSGNAAGAVAVVRVIGVNAANEEVTENVSVNGTATSLTVNDYKCVNDIIQISGNMMYAGRIITCRCGGGTPQNVRIQIGGDFKLNPLFMCSKKDGKNRKARLVSIDGTAFATATSHIALHVFGNNQITVGAIGRYKPALRIYDIPITNTMPILFNDDSVVEIGIGETAVWFKETATTTTFMTWTWELFYTD